MAVSPDLVSLCWYETRSFARQNASQKKPGRRRVMLGGRSMNFRVETNIQPTTNSHSSSVIHTARSKVTLPLYHLFPNLRSDLQLSSLRNAVHLSTSMTLTISSHCSSPSLQPWPAFFRPGLSPATAPDWHEWHYRIQRLIKTNCSLLIPLHHLQRQSNTYSTDTIMSRHGAQQNTWNSL